MPSKELLALVEPVEHVDGAIIDGELQLVEALRSMGACMEATRRAGEDTTRRVAFRVVVGPHCRESRGITIEQRPIDATVESLGARG